MTLTLALVIAAGVVFATASVIAAIRVSKDSPVWMKCANCGVYHNEFGHQQFSEPNGYDVLGRPALCPDCDKKKKENMRLLTKGLRK